MNPIPIKKLYNPQYDLLSIKDKEELLSQIGKIYNLELLCFDEFDAFGKSTYTAIYRSYDGIDFVFVPGDTVRLGLNFDNKKLQDIFDKESLMDLVYVFLDGYEDEIYSEVWNFVQFQIATKFTFDGASCFFKPDLSFLII